MIGDGIIIRGDQILHWNTHSVDTSNTVNGKPVYYWNDRVGGTVPFGAGQVILANCTNVVVENHNLSDGSAGIILGFSSNNTIANNTANSNNYEGIYLSSSSNNTLTNNTANSNNLYGIRLSSSSGNAVTGNTANSNVENGIYLYSSNNNTLTQNNASNSTGAWYSSGIYLSFSSNNTFSYNIANSNNVYGIYLYSSSNNNLTGNNASNNNYSGIELWPECNNNTLTGNTASNNSQGIVLGFSSNNTLTGNIASNNNYGIWLSSSNNNMLTNNTINLNNNYGIWLWYSSNNNHIYNNYFDNALNAYDEGNNIWNITQTPGTNIIGGPNFGGNYWSDYTGIDTNCDGIGDTKRPYNSSGGVQTGGDWLPLVKPLVFDIREGTYPSIAGVHNGTIMPFYNINVSKLYTYPCPGTGGHAEYIKIWNSTTGWNVTATWDGYVGDWQNISFNKSFTLYANETYNYTIRTGSYPQIHHNRTLRTGNGWINCTDFTDVNGKIFDNWIPAIRLF